MKSKVFTAQEVQSIIAGTKTMFREVLKTQTKTNEPLNLAYTTPYRTWEWGNSGVYVEEPYEVGQKIFVKEGIAHGGYFGACFVYCADGAFSNKMWQTHWSRHFSPANYMNKKQSRLTLEITDVKVERLAEISEEDAIAEGVFKSKDYWHSTLHPTKGTYQCWTSSQKAFGKLWNATHKKPEEKFEANPFCWVVDFKINK